MSAVPKLSPWFPGSWWPGLPGVYQRQHGGLPHFSRWDGRFWYGEAATVADAADRRVPSRHQMITWRGLAEPPQ
ncbi:MAG: hypothetical protein QG602_1755 [Verrucomicrobiota bacterium]|nr:hypothetical protein [Verrucomicrobiota bacterium]